MRVRCGTPRLNHPVPHPLVRKSERPRAGFERLGLRPDFVHAPLQQSELVAGRLSLTKKAVKLCPLYNSFEQSKSVSPIGRTYPRLRSMFRTGNTSVFGDIEMRTK